MSRLPPNQADQYFLELPQRIKEYLINQRGISWPVIERHRIGWHGGRITIPVYDRQGRLALFKLARDPQSAGDAPKMRYWPHGATAELYGWEHVTGQRKETIVICEGEYDRLVLESRDIPATTSTGGAMTFDEGWAEYFAGISDVYICYDNDAAGTRGAEKVAKLIPHARIVTLPEEVGKGGDVTDFFVRLKKTSDDFFKLLEKAEPLPRVAHSADTQAQGTMPTMIPKRIRPESLHQIAEEIKASARIEAVVGHYVTLKRSGQRYVGRCCFHDDRIPSLVVYPKTNSFYCFGCSTAGDAIRFVMEIERLGFPQALEVLARYAGYLWPQRQTTSKQSLTV